MRHDTIESRFHASGIGFRAGDGQGQDERRRLVAVTLDEASIGRGNPDQEHERAVAVYDIVEANSFAVPNYDGSPYALHLALVEKKLCFDIRTPRVPRSWRTTSPHAVPRRDPRLRDDLRQLLQGDPHRFAVPDRSDRHGPARHNEAAELLMKRLDGKVELDFDTARRIFTLIFALHWKG